MNATTSVLTAHAASGELIDLTEIALRHAWMKTWLITVNHDRALAYPDLTPRPLGFEKGIGAGLEHAA